MKLVNRLTVHGAISSFKMYMELMNSCMHKTAEELGISGREAHILISLSDNPTVDTASEMARLGGVSKAYVSRGVESLIEKGLVEAVKDENDGRMQHLKLLPESEKYTVVLVNTGLEIINRLLDGTTADERKKTADLFDKMTENAVRIRKNQKLRKEETL